MFVSVEISSLSWLIVSRRVYASGCMCADVDLFIPATECFPCCVVCLTVVMIIKLKEKPSRVTFDQSAQISNKNSENLLPFEMI